MKTITKDGKKPRKRLPDKTKLWYVYTQLRAVSIITVSNKSPSEISEYCGCFRIKVRTISPRAAARVYIRNNLMYDIAKGKFEVEEVEKWMIDRLKPYKYKEKAIIKVVKQ